MFFSQWKIVLAGAAIFAVTNCGSVEVQAQGFRIGNFVQAGGGQGFRMGGPRFGMHFGGGQGASIGGQNVGMRFGNGQGARFGGVNYGMQFGGGQGTQIGQLYTTPSVTPGTYYYGDVRGTGYGQPGYVPQPGVAGPGLPTVTQPMQGDAPGYETQVNAPVSSASNPDGFIRLSLPADANAGMTYRLNGTEFLLEPGRYVLMASGQPWQVEFSAGEGLGQRQAVLSDAGNYTFSQSPAGNWELVNADSIANTQTKVAKPDADQAVSPPTEDANVFDDFNKSEQKSVLMNDQATIEKPTPESANEAQVPAENSEADLINDPNEVQVVPAEKPSDDGGK